MKKSCRKIWKRAGNGSTFATANGKRRPGRGRIRGWDLEKPWGVVNFASRPTGPGEDIEMMLQTTGRRGRRPGRRQRERETRGEALAAAPICAAAAGESKDNRKNKRKKNTTTKSLILAQDER